MMPTAPIVVLGAGPAGARAAELLARMGSSVVLLDPRAPWEKPCGGGLTPAAFDGIPELIELESSAREISRVRVELSPDEGFTVELRRPMQVISRRDLGLWLLDRAVAAGAVHRAWRVRTIRRSGGGWLLDTDGDVVRTPFLLGADGAASLVRRVAAPGFRVELAPTRLAYLPGPGPTPDVAVVRVFEGTAGYLWDFPRADHRSVGIMVSPRSLQRDALDREVDAYRETVEGPLRSAPRRAGAVIGTAQLGHGAYDHIVGSDFALLGDAAGLADPLTGEGIQNALRSAQLFTRAWASGDPRRYRRLLRRELGGEFAFSRFLRRVFMEGDVGIRLVRRALHSDAAYAAVSALLNALNEHDFRVSRLPAKWLWALSRVRAEAASAARGRREPYLASGGGSSAPASSEPVDDAMTAA